MLLDGGYRNIWRENSAVAQSTIAEDLQEVYEVRVI